jgi:hypothetical protein
MLQQMKFVTLCCVAILVVSCSSIDDKIRSTPIADQRLRREQLIYRLNGTEWGPGAREYRHDLYEEKEAIERELLPREKAGISDSDLRRACLRSRQDFVETGIAKRT